MGACVGVIGRAQQVRSEGPELISMFARRGRRYSHSICALFDSLHNRVLSKYS